MELNPRIWIAADTDSYKFSHWQQLPPGLSWMQSHFIPRSGTDPYVVFAGLQPLLMWLKKCVTKAEVLDLGLMAESHGLPFNYAGWAEIADLGFYPIRIRALPEGTRVPIGVPCFTVESTGGPETAWIVTYLETQLLRTWAPTNVATISEKCRRIIMQALEETADNPKDEIEFKLHDFGSRGCSSTESASFGGIGHLFSFKGTDTFSAIQAAYHAYNSHMAGFSIPASEHSTITAWGRANEFEAFSNILDKYPTGLVACVSDSYDLTNAIMNHWARLKDRILARKGTLVIRPDSGDPVETAAHCMGCLETVFGTTINSKGFKVLPPQVRMIYGDGINPITISLILEEFIKQGWSASNIAFGMGGALLQQHNRDTHGFAYKCNAVEVSGEFRSISKSAPGKKSLAGYVDVVMDGNQLQVVTEPKRHPVGVPESAMRTVFLDGELHNTESLSTIRKRLWG